MATSAYLSDTDEYLADIEYDSESNNYYPKRKIKNSSSSNNNDANNKDIQLIEQIPLQSEHQPHALHPPITGVISSAAYNITTVPITPPEITCLCCKGGTAIFFKYVIPTTLSLILYFLDVYTDLSAAYADYITGDTVFAISTLCLVFAPGLVFSFYLFSEVRSNNKGFMRCLKAPLCFFVIPILPIWPIINNLKRIIYGILASFDVNRSDYLIKLASPSKAYLLNFLQAYTESAPQLLVRLFRIATRSDSHFRGIRLVEISQVCFSMLSLASAVPSTYQQYITTSGVISGQNQTLSLVTKILATVWWLFYLIARFEAMSLFAAAYGWWIALVIGLHMVVLFIIQEVSTTMNILKRTLIYIFQSFVFIFAYIQFNVKTRISMPLWIPYVIFSILMFLENSLMMVLWFLRSHILTATSTTATPSSDDILTTAMPSGEKTHHYNHHHHMSNPDSDIEVTSSPHDVHRIYDEILMMIHFLSYTIGLVFMLLTFCYSSSRRHNQDENDAENIVSQAVNKRHESALLNQDEQEKDKREIR